MCAICLASSAIRCCFVETVSGLGVPAIFPSSGSVFRLSPSLRRVLRSPFPCFIGTIGELRLPAVHPVLLRLLALRYHLLVPRFAPLDRRTFWVQGLEVSGSAPTATTPYYQSGNDRISQVPGESLLQACPALRPRWADQPSPFITHWPVCCLPHLEQRRPPPCRLFRGSITRPACSLSTLHWPGYPDCNARLATGLLAKLCPGGTFTHWIPITNFKETSTISYSNVPSFAWRTQGLTPSLYTPPKEAYEGEG